MRQFAPAVTDRKMRFALVGCGRIAHNHFGALRQHAARCELVGVCDIDPSALDRAAGQTGARPYASLAQMLAQCDADACIIATPSGLHPEQAVQIGRASCRERVCMSV